MKRLRDLTDSERQTWAEDAPRRQQTREKLGQKAIAAYRRINAMPEHLKIVSEISTDLKFRRMGAESPDLDVLDGRDILIDEFKWAAAANLGPQGENLDVAVDILDPSHLNTADEIEEWGNTYRFAHQYRERYIQEMKDGTRLMFVAMDKNGEPAGRAFLIIGGPHNNKPEEGPELEEFVGRPSEPEVKAIIGENAAWGEENIVLEGYRGGGVGPRLILAREKYIKEHPEMPQRFSLAVKPDNVVARHVFSRLGYQHTLVDGQETFISHIEGIGRPVMLMTKKL